MQYTTKKQQDRDARRRRHEAFLLARYSPETATGLRKRKAWRNIAVANALSESREVPDWPSFIKPSHYEWEYFTDGGSKEFLEDIQDYVASGRALADGISEDVCRLILGVGVEND